MTMNILSLYITQNLLCRSQVHVSRAQPNVPVSRRRPGCLREEVSRESSRLLGIVAKDVLVGVFFHRMTYLENLSLSSFSLLMEATRRTKESVRKTSKSISIIKYAPKKRPMIAAVEKNKRAKASSSKRCLIRRENRRFPVLSPFPCV